MHIAYSVYVFCQCGLKHIHTGLFYICIFLATANELAILQEKFAANFDRMSENLLKVCEVLGLPLFLLQTMSIFLTQLSLVFTNQ